MALTREQFEDLLAYLRDHPEAREELRPVVLGPAHEATPSRMDRVEAALEQLTIDIAEMRAHGREVDARIAEMRAHGREVDARIAANAEQSEARGREIDARIDRLTERMDEQTARLDETNRSLERLITRIDKATETLENQGRQLGRYTQLEGRMLEQAYVQNSTNWFNTRLVRARRVFVREIPEVQSALESGQLSRPELEDISLLDLLVGGTDADSGGPKFIALEVSSTLNDEDIQRVARRSSLLRRAGVDVAAVAGGYAIPDQTRRRAESLGVEVDLRESPH